MSKCHIVGTLTSRLIYMGVKKNRLIENPQHMIWLRMSKLIFIYTLLSKGLRSPLTVVKSKYLKPQILNLGQQSKTLKQNQTRYPQPLSLYAVHNCYFTVFVNFKLLVPVGRNTGGVNQLFRCLFNFNTVAQHFNSLNF